MKPLTDEQGRLIHCEVCDLYPAVLEHGDRRVCSACKAFITGADGGRANEAREAIYIQREELTSGLISFTFDVAAPPHMNDICRNTERVVLQCSCPDCCADRAAHRRALRRGFRTYLEKVRDHRDERIDEIEREQQKTGSQ